LITDLDQRLAAALDELDVSDETATAVIDLLYALGDLLADHFVHRLRRQQQRRHQTIEPEYAIDPRQLDLFSADLLDPF